MASQTTRPIGIRTRNRESWNRNGCARCKKQSKKCDGSKPTCNRCAKGKSECNYQTTFKWVERSQTPALTSREEPSQTPELTSRKRKHYTSSVRESKRTLRSEAGLQSSEGPFSGTAPHDGMGNQGHADMQDGLNRHQSFFESPPEETNRALPPRAATGNEVETSQYMERMPDVSFEDYSVVMSSLEEFLAYELQTADAALY